MNILGLGDLLLERSKKLGDTLSLTGTMGVLIGERRVASVPLISVW